jgi:hypothetical protein
MWYSDAALFHFSPARLVIVYTNYNTYNTYRGPIAIHRHVMLLLGYAVFTLMYVVALVVPNDETPIPVVKVLPP